MKSLSNHQQSTDETILPPEDRIKPLLDRNDHILINSHIIRAVHGVRIGALIKESTDPSKGSGAVPVSTAVWATASPQKEGGSKFAIFALPVGPLFTPSMVSFFRRRRVRIEYEITRKQHTRRKS